MAYSVVEDNAKILQSVVTELRAILGLKYNESLKQAIILLKEKVDRYEENA